MPIKTEYIQRILVLKLRYIGDAVLTTPLLRTFRKSMPQAEVDVAVPAGAHALLQNQPFVHTVWPFDHKFSKNGKYILRFLAGLRKRKYDLAIDLTNNDRGSLFAFLSGAPVRLGYASGHFVRNRILYTDVIQSVLGEIHTSDHHLKMAEYLGLPISDRNPAMTVAAEERNRFFRKIIKLDKEKPLLVIHPGARRWYKSWPLERFAALADRAVEQFGAQVVVTGSREDAGQAAEVVNKMQNSSLDLSGRLQLPELAALISAATCFLGNDSGPLHIATAVKTPAVALFGPTRWEAWGPRRDQDTIVAAHYPCRPCGHSRPDCPLGKKYCMNSISVEEAWQPVMQALRRGSLVF